MAHMPWTIDHGPHLGQRLELIRPSELATLPGGTTLMSIAGERVVVGVDSIDGDTRGGWLAYGYIVPIHPEGP